MDRKKNSSAFDAPFKTLGFVFRHAESNQSADERADRSTHTDAGEYCHDGPGGNVGTESGNREHSNAGQQSERAANHGSGSAASDCGLGCLSVLRYSEILGTGI